MIGGVGNVSAKACLQICMEVGTCTMPVHGRVIVLPGHCAARLKARHIMGIEAHVLLTTARARPVSSSTRKPMHEARHASSTPSSCLTDSMIHACAAALQQQSVTIQLRCNPSACPSNTLAIGATSDRLVVGKGQKKKATPVWSIRGYSKENESPYSHTHRITSSMGQHGA